MLNHTGGINHGTYGVREIGSNVAGNKEKILHAPKGTMGRFDLWVYPDGTLEYRPRLSSCERGNRQRR